MEGVAIIQGRIRARIRHSLIICSVVEATLVYVNRCKTNHAIVLRSARIDSRKRWVSSRAERKK